MKLLKIKLCIVGLLLTLLCPALLSAQPIPLVQGEAYFFEYGHFDKDSTGIVRTVVSDTVVTCNVPIKIYEDAVVIQAEMSQDYSLGSILQKYDTETYYMVMFEGVDQEYDRCHVVIYYNKETNLHILTINFKNIYWRYYL